ncbi:MAG: mycofactocin radical SAM maturase [Firmicutes bacterium]|nr:mycofactocin radical SAM maturase [Bacillota bacterium]
MRFESLANDLTAPITVTWEVTYACNLGCAHCLSSSGKRQSNELTIEQARKMIDDMVDMGVFYINLGGGEPFARLDFIELLTYATERGLPCQFSTNGMLITAERAKRLGELADIRVQVSLDGADVETNDAIRGTGSYVGALRALDLLGREPLDELWLNSVVTRRNIDQLDDLYNIAKDKGARLRLARMRPSGRGQASWNDLHLSLEQHAKVFEWLASHRDVTTGDSYFILNALAALSRKDGESWMEGFNTCGAARATCCITPTGDVYPCAFLLGTDFNAGNVKDVPLSRMWAESPVMQMFRNTAASGECDGCPAHSHCGGGCRAVAYYERGTIVARDPECLLPMAAAMSVR